ncbi:MAG: hypothetical protein QM690_15510 [Sphingobium sp.]
MNRRFDWRLPACAVLFILFLFCWWHWSGWQHRAWIAAGFGARVACSCRQVEGRGMESCRKDFTNLEGMGLVHLSDREDGRGVDASVPLLAHRSARVVPGFGCVLEP